MATAAFLVKLAGWCLAGWVVWKWPNLRGKDE
jgi:hypothetical protein